jgi:hypothetical protein
VLCDTIIESQNDCEPILFFSANLAAAAGAATSGSGYRCSGACAKHRIRNRKALGTSASTRKDQRLQGFFQELIGGDEVGFDVDGDFV